MNYLPIKMPVLEKLTEIIYTKKKRVYKDEGTGIIYYWFRNKGKGSKKGYYVDLDTVSNKEAFMKMSENFEEERKEYEKEKYEKEAHRKWAHLNHQGIKAVVGEEGDITYYNDSELISKNWKDEKKKEAEKYQNKYDVEIKRKEKEILDRIKSLPQPLREFADDEGVFHGFEISDNSQSSGRGYSGYSESINSRIAKSEGKFPKTSAAKILKVKPIDIQVDLSPCECHHTSKHYNTIDFYDIRPYYYLMHNQIDNLYEYLEEIDCVDMDDENEINEYIDNYKKHIIKWYPKKGKLNEIRN